MTYKIEITQNDRKPLDIGREIWGGFIRQRIRKSPVSDKICIGHSWTLNHNQAVEFLKSIKPYLLIPYKINQIQKCQENLTKIWDIRFKCNFCDLDFSDASGRRRHEKKEHINNGQLHKCNNCEKTYKSKDSMNRHIKLNHKLNG